MDSDLLALKDLGFELEQVIDPKLMK